MRRRRSPPPRGGPLGLLCLFGPVCLLGLLITAPLDAQEPPAPASPPTAQPAWLQLRQPPHPPQDPEAEEDEVPGPPVVPSPRPPYAVPPAPAPVPYDVYEEEEDEDRPRVYRPRPRRPAPPPSIGYGGALRAGLYADGDSTLIFRMLAGLTGQGRNWSVSGSAGVDVVSSASVDVRSSPLGKVDVVTSASGSKSSSGGSMSDRRLAGTLGTGWRDGAGHAINASLSVANETDYNSVGGGLNGAFDLAERTVTLLGGVSGTHNWVASVLDSRFAQQMWTVGWTGGVAPVLSPRDVLRLRYDGLYASGYQGSPYRNVRFGSWTTSTSNDGRITFANTTGSTSGYAEKVPDLRHRHALVLDWLHALSPRWALALSLRGGTDSWGIRSATPGAELRYAGDTFRFRLGYRFHYQTGADFYQPKYVLSVDKYDYYTSDKELSREYGHIGNAGMAWVLAKSRGPNDSRLLLDVGLTVLYYSYPDFILLPSRGAAWIDMGLTWEL